MIQLRSVEDPFRTRLLGFSITQKVQDWALTGGRTGVTRQEFEIKYTMSCDVRESESSAVEE
jgi:hypothetical protein